MTIDTEAVLRLARDIEAEPGDLTAACFAVYERLSLRRTVALSPLSPEQRFMRLVVQTAVSDDLALALDDVRRFGFSRDWHVDNPADHSECCESPGCERGDCTDRGVRGPSCEAHPHDALDDAVRTLRDVLRAQVGSAAVDGVSERAA